MAHVKISHPLNRQTVGQDFFAQGRAKSDVKRVEAVLQPHGGGADIRPKKIARYQVAAGEGFRYRWMLLFRLKKDEIGKPYTLVVQGFDASTGGNPIGQPERREFEVREAGAKGLEIQYPANDGYVITGDEINNFMTYGTTTDFIDSATLGPQAADFIYDDLQENFWAATFPPLTSSANQTITVTNRSSDTRPRNVVVDQ
jgi:hypothetical protein